MSAANNCVLIGNLTKDPTLKHVGENQTAIAEFSIAVNDSRDKKNNVDYFDCKILGKGAEIFCQYMRVGKKVSLSGKMKQESWEKEGQKRSKHVLLVSDFEFLSPNSDGGSEESNNVVPMNRDNKPAPSLVVPANAPDYNEIPF